MENFAVVSCGDSHGNEIQVVFRGKFQRENGWEFEKY